MDIKKAVIHVLDRDANEPLLNEFEMDINEDIYSFLEKHITRSINDDDARKARFKDGRNVVKEVSKRMSAESDYFLEGSREIARQLFKAMKTNSSISSTDLIVCLYEDNNETFIAILKMDYGTSYIHDIETVGEKFKISIRKQDISLPGISQKIQKCAFVRTYNSNDYDLIALDNQINSSGSKEPVAQFFIQTFLDSELVIDSKVCTKIFKKETENWIRNKSKDGETSVEEVRNHVINTILEEDEIDIEAFSYKAFGNKLDLREDYVNNLKEKGLVNEKFDIDKDWVDRKLSKIRLKTEGNIEVIIPYEDFMDKDKFEIISNNDGTRSIIIKNFTSLSER